MLRRGGVPHRNGACGKRVKGCVVKRNGGKTQVYDRKTQVCNVFDLDGGLMYGFLGLMTD